MIFVFFTPAIIFIVVVLYLQHGFNASQIEWNKTQVEINQFVFDRLKELEKTSDSHRFQSR